MWLRFKILCSCQCSYTVGENIKLEKIVCPNCGLEHPNSEKLLSILKIANDINDYCSETDIVTQVIPFQ